MWVASTLSGVGVASGSSLDGCPEALIVTFGDRAPTACRIAACEVGNKINPETGTFDNRLVGSAGEVSLAQVHPIHFGRYDRQRLIDDEWYVAEVMYELSNGGSNWRPWSCY